MTNKSELVTTYPISEIPRNCDDCVGACCKKGVTLPLTDVELQFMENSGAELDYYSTFDKKTSKLSKLASFISGKKQQENVSIYEFTEDCPFLEDNQCQIYDSPDKPEICSNMKADSYSCLNIRMDAGLETNVSVNNRLQIKD